MLKKILGMLGLVMAGKGIDRLAMAAASTPQAGYYHRYTGRSKTFKKNKRRGL
jgi:hypothetical protein